MNPTYRLLYCSKNLIQGPLEQQRAEVKAILAKSRANNPERGLTGALLFNDGYFAQVLEGPSAEVERTFETIQRDMRHNEISVLEFGIVPQRDFPDWSMAFAGFGAADAENFAGLSLAEALADTADPAARTRDLLLQLVARENELNYA